MTEQEFKSQLLPVLSGLWRRMVVKPPKNASEFDLAAAREGNRKIFAILGRFEVNAACEAARTFAAEHAGEPTGDGYDRVLSGIRGMLQGDRRTVLDDPALWTWRDECNLGHLLETYRVSVAAGRLPRHFQDCLWLARNLLGKNPSSFERDEARRVLVDHITKTHDRMVERGRPREEAEQMYPFPNW